ncbi:MULTISPECIES: hypothetical protein [unclassified Nocardia]|uniref:hypothetical protein n=1 Tax=unclassified Nocardia TaxID=2637762 RepID=UPI001CE46D1A|nr:MULTISPECIES: hypothetical protein [unclassified Nocardia]
MAFDIEFTRTFRHHPWADQKDLVVADGTEGFNIRFKALEADLDTLRDRFADVGVALDSVVAPKADRILTVTPFFAPVDQFPWYLGQVGIAKRDPSSTSGPGQVNGVLPVSMPPSGTIASLRVVGSGASNGPVTVRLLRSDPQGRITEVAKVQPPPTPNGDTPFDVTSPANPANATIDPLSVYVITAEFVSRVKDELMQISGLQLLIKPS